MPSPHNQQQEKFETARFELHQLLAQPSLTGVPLLVVSVPNGLSAAYHRMRNNAFGSLGTRTTLRAMPPYRNLSERCKPRLFSFELPQAK